MGQDELDAQLLRHAPRAGSAGAAVKEPIVALALVALFLETYFRGLGILPGTRESGQITCS